MIKAIINGLLSIITSLVDVFLTPINLLIENLFPDFSNIVNTFNQFVSNYVGGSLSYFFSILPSTFKSILIIWFTFVVGYYSIYYTYTSIIKVFNIIQKIKFW